MNNKLFHLLISAIKLIYWNSIHSIVQVPYSAYLCIKLFRDKKKHYMVICDHIGDYIFTIGYLEAFLKKNKINNITICTTNNLLVLNVRYKNKNINTKILDPKTLYQIIALSSTDFGLHVLRKLGNITIINPDNAFMEKHFEYLMRYPNIHFHECIKYGSLALEEDEHFVPPKIDRKITNKSNNSRKVLLCPDSRFINGDNLNYCLQEIASILVMNKYEVFTNIFNSTQIPIDGTKPFRGSLNELIDFVDSGVDVVGVRSGVLDLLSFCNCKVVAIYPNNKYMNFFDLNFIPERKASIIQVSIEDSNYLKKIIYFLR